MTLLKMYQNKVLVLLIGFTLILGVVFSSSSAFCAKPAGDQKTFASPEEAVEAFIDALKAGNKEMLLPVFGSKSVLQISSGDDVRDRADREWFLSAYNTRKFLEKKGNDRVILHVGNDYWPFPFPLIKKGNAWFFNSEEGKEELLNRRIGRNELRVMETMEAYVAAQREYADKDETSGGIHAYAQKFMSTPGKKDGLYWQVKEGEEESPLGPLVAMAAREGYTGKAKTPVPFQGYYFKILTGQGKNAQGGTYDYVIKGNMILGFGLLAYPAKYGYSGIMTFIVNQQGVVYQKDLGKKTAKVAAGIRKYDPDETWQKIESKAGDTLQNSPINSPE